MPAGTIEVDLVHDLFASKSNDCASNTLTLSMVNERPTKAPRRQPAGADLAALDDPLLKKARFQAKR